MDAASTGAPEQPTDGASPSDGSAAPIASPEATPPPAAPMTPVASLTHASPVVASTFNSAPSLPSAAAPTPAEAAPPAAPAAAGRLPQPNQIEATLDHLAGLCTRLEQAELRFKQLTDQCEGVLQGLVSVDRRHSGVVANLNQRLGDWCQLESKLLEESARRIEQFERGIGHEWMVIRQLHEEPIAQLKEQAEQLRLGCLEAARLARFRLDSAEQAYTAYAADLERRMGEWSRELVKSSGARPALDAGRGDLPSIGLKGAAPPLEPWPLEGVAQLHQELRGAAPSPANLGGDRADRGPLGGVASSAAGPASTSARAKRWPSRAYLAVAGAVFVVLIAVALYALRAAPSQGAVAGGNASERAQAPAAIVRQPAVVAARVDEDRLAEAQRAADRAGVMVDILAALDLRRFPLAGTATSAAGAPYGQVLWSRSRGLAASASRLPPLPDGKVYQLWIVPDGAPVAVGELVPDQAGRASLIVPGPLKLPLPITIRVTLEERGQAAVPRGPVLLQRVPAA